MPMYEYQCEACAHRFEIIRKFSDPPVEKCPSCGGRVRKLLSSPAIQFKGSGWYVTDYAKKDQATTTQAESANGTGVKEKTETADKSAAGQSEAAPASSSTGPARPSTTKDV